MQNKIKATEVLKAIGLVNKRSCQTGQTLKSAVSVYSKYLISGCPNHRKLQVILKSLDRKNTGTNNLKMKKLYNRSKIGLYRLTLQKPINFKQRDIYEEPEKIIDALFLSQFNDG